MRLSINKIMSLSAMIFILISGGLLYISIDSIIYQIGVDELIMYSVAIVLFFIGKQLLKGE
jgi:hypothetical protein|tara:strand:- start:43 stop:225 length:183 start_codon:yes stop_codon:yes gene_type:complete